MKQFLTVLRFELNNYFKNKSFVITTLLLALVIAAVVIVPTFIPGLLGEESKETEPESSEENVLDVEADEEDAEAVYGILIKEDASSVNLEMISTVFPADWKNFDSEKEIRKAVEAGEVEAGFVMKTPKDVTYVVNDLSMYDYLGDMFSQTLSECYKKQYLMEKGLTAEDIAESESFYVNVEEVREYTPETETQISYGRELWLALTDGLRSVGDFFKELLVFLVGALPSLAVLAVFIIIARPLFRKLRNKRKAKKQPKSD